MSNFVFTDQTDGIVGNILGVVLGGVVIVALLTIISVMFVYQIRERVSCLKLLFKQHAYYLYTLCCCKHICAYIHTCIPMLL